VLRLSRRNLLVAAAGLGCARRKATPFHGFCFVANEGSRSIAVVDLARFRLRKEIPLDAAPAAVIPHSLSAKVYVLAPETGTIYEVDAVNLAISRRARAGNRALSMQLSADARALWVLYREPAALQEFPLDSFRPRQRFSLPSPPQAFDLSVENQVAVALPAENRIALFSLKASENRFIPLTAEPSIVRFRADGMQVIAASGKERALTLLDVPTGKTAVRLTLPLDPRHLCFSPDGGHLFVSGDGMDAVVTIYPYRTEVAETMLAGRAPAGMVATDSLLLVTNPETNSVTVLDFDNQGKKLVSVVQVGQGPRNIVITPENEYALVVNEKSGDLAVVRILSLTAYPNGEKRRYQIAPLFTLIPVGEKPVSAGVVRFA
jgi:DNA-binding beta-propeller fold protein YncE